MIRPAEAGDIPRLLELGRLFHAESQYEAFGVDFDDEELASAFEQLLDTEAGAIFVAERSGLVCGMAAVAITKAFMSRRALAVEPFFWMHPEHRGSLDAVRLILALEKWAATNGCVALTMIELDRIPGSPASRIYRKLGYEPAERTWIKKV